MKGFCIILLLLFAIILRSAAETQPLSAADKAYGNLIGKSAINLNASSRLPEDSIISLCHRIEASSRPSKDKARFFKVGQIMVNAYAMKGDLALAANKAQQLLDEALGSHNELETGLAIQALGNTYMHTNRYELADSAYREAMPYMLRHGDQTMQIQLQLQQLHIFFKLADTARMRLGLTAAEEMLQTCDLPEKYDYSILKTCYEGFYALQIGNTPQAYKLLRQLESEKPSDGLFDIWLHNLASQYYESTGVYDIALDYTDSMMQAAKLQYNGNQLRSILLSQANLFEKAQMPDSACTSYFDIYNLTDSLYKAQYLSQIDSLHVTYWIDHLQMYNINRRNMAYAKIIGSLLLIILATIVMVVYIRRSNLQLEASRRKLEEMREASADSIRSKSLFLSNMSHELRTPLNAIMGFSTILTEDEEIDEETRQQCSAYIRQNADLLMKLIGDVVDFSGLKGESIKFSYTDCDVVMLCRNVLKTIQNVKRTEAELYFTTDLETLQLCTDPNRLQQVLINLMVNATKFTKTGSITLRLSVDPERDEAVFSVEDTGCGIPLDRQPRIFERFEKLHETAQGAGLGLSICKLIVEHVGGRIWIDSSYTQGARFVFTHPLHFTPNAQ